MSDKQKPDGYVAWHPEKGADMYTASAINAEFPRSRLMAKIFNVRDKDIESTFEVALDESYWELWKRLEKAGWRIRPVKLLFLDED